MVKILILWAICFADANPEVTSRAMVHFDHWCRVREVAWFGVRQHLEWFDDEARRIGAIDSDTILWPFVDPSEWDSTPLNVKIEGAVNDVRVKTWMKNLNIQHQKDLK